VHCHRKSTEQEQLDFRDWELAHSEARAAGLIARAPTAGDAGAAITRFYERPRERDRDAADRANVAEAIMQLVLQSDSANSNAKLERSRQQRQGRLGRRTGQIRD
jgi:hypothetical protein